MIVSSSDLPLYAHMDVLTSFIARVGDEALIAIGQCSSLQYLNVSGCHQIGDAGMIAIARGCPLLTYLDVSVLQVCVSHSLILKLKIFLKNVVGKSFSSFNKE